MTRSLEMLVGGSWHDAAGFAGVVLPWLTRDGWDASVTDDPARLAAIAALNPEATLLYTCYDEHTPLHHEPAHLRALTQWVEQGGGLLALHASAVAARTAPELRRLLGGAFVAHPPKQRFRVRPSRAAHPLIAGLDSFEVEDEPYRCELQADVEVLLESAIDGAREPIAWSRAAGAGRVLYLALGHDRAAWEIPVFRELVLRGLRWVVRAEPMNPG